MIGASNAASFTENDASPAQPYARHSKLVSYRAVTLRLSTCIICLPWPLADLHHGRERCIFLSCSFLISLCGHSVCFWHAQLVPLHGNVFEGSRRRNNGFQHGLRYTYPSNQTPPLTTAIFFLTFHCADSDKALRHTHQRSDCQVQGTKRLRCTIPSTLFSQHHTASVVKSKDRRWLTKH